MDSSTQVWHEPSWVPFDIRNWAIERLFFDCHLLYWFVMFCECIRWLCLVNEHASCYIFEYYYYGIIICIETFSRVVLRHNITDQYKRRQSKNKIAQFLIPNGTRIWFVSYLSFLERDFGFGQIRHLYGPLWRRTRLYSGSYLVTNVLQRLVRKYHRTKSKVIIYTIK